MSDASSNNFEILITPSLVIKSIGEDGSEELRTRLAREHAAYNLLEEANCTLVPLTDPEQIDEHEGIALQRLSSLGEVVLGTRLSIVSTIQDIVEPDSNQLETLKFADYLTRGHRMLDKLATKGPIGGMGTAEADISKTLLYQLFEECMGHEELFRTVLVNYDAQKRHFGFSGTEPKLFDWDQAHFGPEIVDFAFMAMRHPLERRQIASYLKNRYGHSSQQHKQEAIDPTMRFFINYFLVKGVYDRMHQPRGKAFDHAAKAYGRLMLFGPAVVNGINNLTRNVELEDLTG